MRSLPTTYAYSNRSVSESSSGDSTTVSGLGMANVS